MDHSPYPANPVFPPLFVPYHDQFIYDGETFAGFPARCGFDKDRQVERPFVWIPWDSQTAFHQAWLYFGVLHEVLNAPAVDFITVNEGSKQISSARLPHYLHVWSERIKKMRSAQAVRELQRCNDCLLEASRVARSLPRFPHHNIDLRVLCSIIDMGSTVTTVVQNAAIHEPWKSEILQIPGITEPWNSSMNENEKASSMYPAWPQNEYTTSQLRSTLYCAAEQRRIIRGADFGPSTLLYCAALPPVGIHRSHSQCLEDRCIAEQMDEHSYRTEHLERDCNCDEIGPVLEDLMSALDANTYPVLRLTQPTGKDSPSIEIKALPYKRIAVRYTALSHVWADGLGNPHHNTLPTCQLLRLHGMVRDLQTNKKTSSAVHKALGTWKRSANEPVYAWLDTLCIPLEKSYRRKAITMMAKTYKQAREVLVLDKTLLPLRMSTPDEEVVLRVFLSPWKRRVWTMQEALLAKTLYIQLADGQFDLTKMAESELKGEAQFSRVLEDARRSLHSLNRVKGVFWGYEGPETSIRTASLLREIGYRSTSRREDVETCMGHMLDFDVGRLFDCAGEERQQAFYEQLEHVPLGMLFNHNPKLSIPGFRWAPIDVRDTSWAHAWTGRRTKQGLNLSCYGIAFNGRPSTNRGSVTTLLDVTSGRCYNVRNNPNQDLRLDQGTDSSREDPNATMYNWALVLESGDFTTTNYTMAAMLHLDDKIQHPDQAKSRQQSSYKGVFVGTARVEIREDRSSSADVSPGFRGVHMGRKLEWCIS